MTTESITHEFPNLLKRLNEGNSDFKKKTAKEPIPIAVCHDFSCRVSMLSGIMAQQLRHVSPALRYARESKEVLNIGDFFESQKEKYYNLYLQKYDIRLNVVNVVPLNVVINEGRFIQVFDNLINNSVYWLRQHATELEQMTITIELKRPWVYVYDNGIGVAPAVEESLFEPFVTTKPQGQGRGLGLFIVRQLLDAVGCSIVLDEVRNVHDRRYKFALNLSNIEAK